MTGRERTREGWQECGCEGWQGQIAGRVTHSGPATVRAGSQLLIPAGVHKGRRLDLSLKINIMKETISVLLGLMLTAASMRTLAQNPGNFSLLNMHAIGTSRSAVRAQRDFLGREGDQKGENWYKISDGFVAEFEEPGIKNSVYYDNRGNWCGSIRFYLSEKVLPEDIRRLVRSTYLDYAIRWVNEIKKSDMLIYNVHIESDTLMKDLLIQDDEIREWKTLSK
jgi:hypothetical protein